MNSKRHTTKKLFQGFEYLEELSETICVRKIKPPKQFLYRSNVLEQNEFILSILPTDMSLPRVYFFLEAIYTKRGRYQICLRGVEHLFVDITKPLIIEKIPQKKKEAFDCE